LPVCDARTPEFSHPREAIDAMVDDRTVAKYAAMAGAIGRVQASVGPSPRQREAALKAGLLIISVVNEQCRSVNGRHAVWQFDLFPRHAGTLFKTPLHGAPDTLADADLSRQHLAIANR